MSAFVSKAALEFLDLDQIRANLKSCPPTFGNND